MKRILHIIGTMDRAGAETMVMNLYRELDTSSYQFDFLYFTDKNCDYDAEIGRLGGKIYRIVSPPGFARFKFVLKFLREYNHFYAIHSHTLLNSGWNVLAAYLTGHKLRISHSHNTSNSTQKSVKERMYYYFSKFLINTFSNRFIACGSAAARFLFYRDKKVSILPNAVNFDDFIDRSLSRVHQRQEGEIIICQIGRFLEVKNHIFTLKLAHFLKTQGISFKILLVGDGILLKKMEALAKDLGIDSQVDFLGLRSDIPAILMSCDVMIMPSLFEGFPVVLVESQVAGIPAVISDSISSEVDLGADLIYFESLNSTFSKWAETIVAVSSIDKKDGKHRYLLERRGFDVKSSLSILLNLYSGV